MIIRKLAEVPLGEIQEAHAESWAVVPEALDEQRNVLANAQDVHKVRRYSEVAHAHGHGLRCNPNCEFWSPDPATSIEGLIEAATP